jgi:hypothetical protein
MSSIVPMYSTALGIKLKIHPNDFASVKAILQEMRYDNNLKSFNFLKVINRYTIQHKEKLNLKFILIYIGC